MFVSVLLLVAAQAAALDACAELAPATAAYVLGPGDQLTIIGSEPEEVVNKPVRIESDGSLKVPLIGRLRAAGLTVESLEMEVARRLRTWVIDPHVTISVTEFRSQRVTVVGSVNNPGTQVLQGNRTLLEALAQAGGLRADAGYSLRITRKVERGRLFLPGAADDPTGRFSIAQINLKTLLSAAVPEENIAVEPGDLISVPRGEMVYVIGNVRRAGGFVLNDSRTVSVLQALSYAEGLAPLASAGKARILRPVPGKERLEIPVDVNRILAGKAKDVALSAGDILFIPGSKLKAVVGRGAEAGLSIGTGLAIYRP